MAITNKVLEFTLELTPGGIPPIIHASQGDVGRTFKANVVWNDSAASAYISGTTVKLRGKKPDKTVFDYSATLSGSAVTFATTEQMTIISGPVECELVFTSGDDVVATANFILCVEESPYNPDAPSESVIPGIVDLIEDTIGGDVRDEVDALIEAHPELMLQDNAVTTPKLADGAVTYAKLDDSLKAYVTPEMFGAVGDGTTDDTAAVNSAFASGLTVFLKSVYYIAGIINCNNATVFGGNGSKLKRASSATLTDALSLNNSRFFNVTFESTNDKPTAWLPETIGTGLYSNVRVAATDCCFYSCRFIAVECLNVNNSANSEIVNCYFKDCTECITGYKNERIAIRGCYINNLEYSGTSAHAIYLSGENENIEITDVYFDNCLIFPIHIFNSTSMGNPGKAIVKDCVINNCTSAVAFNGEYMEIDGIVCENCNDFLWIGGDKPRVIVSGSTINANNSLIGLAQNVVEPIVEVNGNEIATDTLVQNAILGITVQSRNNKYSEPETPGNNGALFFIGNFKYFSSINDEFEYAKHYTTALIYLRTNNTRSFFINSFIRYLGETTQTVFYDSGNDDNTNIINPVLYGNVQTSYNVDSSKITNAIRITAQ